MRVLGIETSGFALGVSIVEDKEVVFDMFINSGVPEAERIIEVLREWGPNPHDIDGIGVSIGPGSFTGLRVGLATAKGLGLVFKKPVAGISTLDAFVVGVPSWGYRISPILDAKRGDIYGASYESDGNRITPYLAISPDEFLEGIQGEHIFAGDGVRIYRDLILKKVGQRAHFVYPNPDFPRASWIAMLAIDRLRNGGDAIDSLEPMYLHPPRIIKRTRTRPDTPVPQPIRTGGLAQTQNVSEEQVGKES